jgi:plastocyanin
MEKTTRRNLLKAAAIGGVTATGLGAALGAEQNPGQGSEHAHDNRPLTGKRAHAVVSFGQWDADPAAPFDREPINTDLENRIRNIHLVLPFEAEVDAGGAVSFIISGVHQILIYGPGADFAAVKEAFELAGSPVLPPIPPGLVDYAVGRVYRGVNPFALQYVPLVPPPAGTMGNLVVDRVEAVNFKEPGRYLVVCGVLPHFNEGMHGYVNVKA